MMMRGKLLWTIVASLSVSVSGCSDQASVKGLSQNDADRLNSQNSRFERNEDPPITAQTYIAAAELALSQNNVHLAIAQYTQALKVDKNSRKATYGLAMLQTQQESYDAALDLWAQYVRLTNDASDAYANLGYASELAGRPQQAESAYQKGIAGDPKNVPCRVNYGLMLARHGRIAEATLQLQAVLSDAEVHYNLASVYEGQGRLEQAKVEYRKALSLHPDMTDAQQRLAALETK